MQKTISIGIYGGTFNPIHNGHLHVLSEFKSRLNLDKMLVIPAYRPPHKKQEQLASSKDRLEMCRLAIAPLGENVEVSDMEIERGGKSYTSDTLAELQRQYPEAKLILLIGEDMFVTLPKWRKAEIILKKAEICVVPRSSEGLERLEELRVEYMAEFQANIHFEQIPFLNVSSTQIRQSVQAGKEISNLVPQQVEEYILNKGIYQRETYMISLGECETAIRPLLSASRYHHSRCVSKAAETLAECYGANPEKAAIAGMLHDIMKDTPREAQLKILERFDIMLSSTEKKISKLLHAITGSVYIRQYLNIDDAEILGAVRWHTSGRAEMTLLEKVVFIADFISEDRDYLGVDKIRQLAGESLEAAIHEGIRFTIEELIQAKSYIEPHTIEAYNDVLGQLKKQ